MITQMERDLVEIEGFELIHDGQHEGVNFFTRRYKKGPLEVTFRHDLRQKRGDIVNFEWHRGKESFQLESRPHKNGRDFFVMQEVK